ncbi:MAG: hypothetical protein WAL95_08905 [Candidatus Acidiferrales bacterium]
MQAQAFGRHCHPVCRRQPSDIAEGGRGDVTIQAEKQEVADRCVVQVRRNLGMLTQAFECITEKKKFSQFGIIEGLDTKMVASAKK